MQRRVLFFSAAFFCIPLFIYMCFSYIYLHRDHINNQYLLQQNTLNFCLQELDNNIFYSKISELSNLSIIRNELYRLYRIVDMSVRSPEISTISVPTPHYTQPQPDINPLTFNRHTTTIPNEETMRTNSNTERINLFSRSNIQDLQTHDTQQRLSRTDRLQAATDAEPYQRKTSSGLDQGPEATDNDIVVNDTPDTNNLYRNNSALDPNALDATKAMNAMTSAESINNSTPSANANANVNVNAEEEAIHQPINTMAHAAAAATATATANNNAANKDGKTQHIRGASEITGSAQVSNVNGLGQVRLINTDRLVLYKHLRQLQSLGFIAFSINTKDPRFDVFIHEGYRGLLDGLRSDERSLRHMIYQGHIPEDGYFIILQDTHTNKRVSIGSPATAPTGPENGIGASSNINVDAHTNLASAAGAAPQTAQGYALSQRTSIARSEDIEQHQISDSEKFLEIEEEEDDKTAVTTASITEGDASDVVAATSGIEGAAAAASTFAATAADTSDVIAAIEGEEDDEDELNTVTNATTSASPNYNLANLRNKVYIPSPDQAVTAKTNTESEKEEEDKEQERKQDRAMAAAVTADIMANNENGKTNNKATDTAAIRSQGAAQAMSMGHFDLEQRYNSTRNHNKPLIAESEKRELLSEFQEENDRNLATFEGEHERTPHIYSYNETTDGAVSAGQQMAIITERSVMRAMGARANIDMGLKNNISSSNGSNRASANASASASSNSLTATPIDTSMGGEGRNPRATTNANIYTSNNTGGGSNVNTSVSVSDALTGGSSYLGIIAKLGFASDQVLVIITDISKLYHQDEVLKRLIANSLNELVLSVGLTTPLSITLLDDQFNPLAGDLSKTEITRLITRGVLQNTTANGMFQGYNKRWGHYLTTGYFKPYNWYILINSDNVRANSSLWQYMLILFTAGFILAVISVHLMGMLCERDAKDIRLINNKIKHMATLLQDPVLLNRVCEGLPRRDDEIGMLASYVRLMGKTVYQSIQEVLHNSVHQSIDQSEKNVITQLRQSAMSREIFIKEYYQKRLHVHTELAPETSGDFYDVIELPHHKIAMVVGSINERGLDAINVAIVNICLIRQMLRLTESIKLPLPKAIMEVNQNIAENNPKTILTSVCIVIIDQRTGKVEYLNAGHTLPILYHKNKGFEYIDVRSGPVLGAQANQNFNSITFDLQEGDSLVMYTDGLLDCTNRRQEKLGQDGFESLLHDEPFENAADTVLNIDAKLKRFTKDSSLEKDYTISCYQYHTFYADQPLHKH